MLRPLPFTTFGEIAALGLAVHVWCLRCKSTTTIDAADPRWAHRGFAGARFRCTRVDWQGKACGAVGAPSIEPPAAGRVPLNSAIRRAFLMCVKCVPPWQIVDVRMDLPPWAGLLGDGDRFLCPYCRGTVGWQWHGGAGVPFTEGFRAGAVPG